MRVALNIANDRVFGNYQLGSLSCEAALLLRMRFLGQNLVHTCAEESLSPKFNAGNSEI
jgi:hypothetical protein